MASPQSSPVQSIPPYSCHGNSSGCKVYTFTDIAHSKDLVGSLSFLRQAEDLCDVILHVGNSHISSHRVVLAASSPYFRAMFTGKPKELKSKLYILSTF